MEAVLGVGDVFQVVRQRREDRLLIAISEHLSGNGPGLPLKRESDETTVLSCESGSESLLIRRTSFCRLTIPSSACWSRFLAETTRGPSYGLSMTAIRDVPRPRTSRYTPSRRIWNGLTSRLGAQPAVLSKTFISRRAGGTSGPRSKTSCSSWTGTELPTGNPVGNEPLISRGRNGIVYRSGPPSVAARNS